MTDGLNSPNWTQFPLTHPIPFTLILLECSPKDVMSCRATCTTWFSWFSSSSTIWSKYHSTFTRLAPSDYRLAKFLEIPVAGEADALSLSVKMHRALKETKSVMNQETFKLLRAMEKRVPVLAPPSVFIRLKVNHPVVTKIVKEVLEKHLDCILVDKTAVDTEDEVRRLVFMNMQQHQFAFINIGKKKTEPSVDTSGSLVLEGEDKLEEALRLSLEAAEVPGEKRKRKRLSLKATEVLGEKRKRNMMSLEAAEVPGEKSKRNESEQPVSKRIKLDSEIEDDDDEEEDIKEKHYIESNSESIYAVKDAVNPEFPTMLELLSIDQPLVEELLVNKCQINTSLIVPQFDEFLHHPGLLASDKLLVGCDSDGKVASVRPETFFKDGGALLGFIENPTSLRKGNNVQFWGGKDIRCRWPEFAKQLDKIDKRDEGIKVERPKGSKLNLPVMAPTLPMQKTPEDGNGETAGPSTSSRSVPDLMERLAARGVSVQRK